MKEPKGGKAYRVVSVEREGSGRKEEKNHGRRGKNSRRPNIMSGWAKKNIKGNNISIPQGHPDHKVETRGDSERTEPGLAKFHRRSGFGHDKILRCCFQRVKGKSPITKKYKKALGKQGEESTQIRRLLSLNYKESHKWRMQSQGGKRREILEDRMAGSGFIGRGKDWRAITTYLNLKLRGGDASALIGVGVR